MGQKPSRRQVVKGIGVSGLGLSQIVPVSGTVSSSGTLVREYRQADDPLENAQISQLQKEVAKEHRSTQGTASPVPVSGPIVDERSPNIVSYAIKVFPDGTSRYHASAVGENPSRVELRDAHQATESFVKAVKNRDEPPVEDR